MRILPTIAKITSWAFMQAHTKHICLVFILFTAFAYPSQALAADATSIQPKQIGGNETITGAFGIKLGEDMNPYIKGSYSNMSKGVPELKGIDVPDKTFRYKELKSPINTKDIFYGAKSVELLGISDDKNRVIELYFTGYWEFSQICRQDSIGPIIREVLREKYRIKTRQIYEDGFEEYGDGEGNKIRMNCGGSIISVSYTSYLMSNYIEQIKVEQQKKKDDIKKSLKGF